jgi:uncharacterized membrane protein
MKERMPMAKLANDPDVLIPPDYSAATRRIDSVDLLRGLVMVIMLLDHTRDYFHHGALNFDPTDLTRTTPVLFFTRWVTHFCAPIFVFLAGTGAYLQLARGKSKRELSWFLLTRGVWLIVLEVTVIRLVAMFNFDLRDLGAAMVIWVIGWSMIVLAGLVFLPLRVVAAFGIAMIALHNLLDSVKVAEWSGPGSAALPVRDVIWMFLHQPGIIPIGDSAFFVLYTLVPWVGVMAVGFAFGKVYRMSPERRRRFLLTLGTVLTLAFVVLRAINIYGDPQRWSVQDKMGFSLLSFVNVTKYPPSLLFLLMTLGPALLALAWIERTERGPLGRILVTFGRVPLFYYVLQWLVAHSLAVVVGYLAGQPVAWQFASFMAKPYPNPNGFDLWVVYVFWIVGLLILYPLCRWFAGVKTLRKDWWLSYV